MYYDASKVKARLEIGHDTLAISIFPRLAGRVVVFRRQSNYESGVIKWTGLGVLSCGRQCEY
jgi:hypothetical protein